ncbi:MAG: GpE family phage tail protein [Oligoflexus sp.]
MAAAADIATVFGWSPKEIDDLAANELETWHKLAVERFPWRAQKR